MKTFAATDDQARTIARLPVGGVIVLVLPVLPQPVRQQVEAIESKKILDVWMMPGTGAFWETDDVPNPDLVSAFCPIGRKGDCVSILERHYQDTRTDYAKERNPTVIYAATPERYAAKRDGVNRCCCRLDGRPETRESCEYNLTDHRFQKIKPAEDMPDWAVRFGLTVLHVEAKRFCEITDEEAEFAGFRFQQTDETDWYPGCDPENVSYKIISELDLFRESWNKQYAKQGLGSDTDCLVWVVTAEKGGKEDAVSESAAVGSE